MKMKNLILIALFSFLLISCSSNDDGGTTSNSLIGKWQIQNVQWSENGGPFLNIDNALVCSSDFYAGWSSNSCQANDTWEFTNSTAISVSHIGQVGNCQSSTFTANYSTQGSTLSWDGYNLNFSISGSTLEVTYTEGNCVTKLTYSRIN